MTCHNCRIDAPRHGKHRNGLQRYRCNKCGKTFTEPHEERFHVEDHLRDERGQLAIKLLVEGNSIRTVERVTGFHRNIIMQLLVIAGERCEAMLATKIQNIPVKDVQCDEIWGFVGKKQAHLGHGDTYQMGDAWCFVAIERHTKLVLTFELGKRTVTSATHFIGKLADATNPEQRFQLTTDGLNAYPYPIGNILGDRVDYAQLIKIYAQDTPEEQRRYSPAHLAEAIPTPVYGDPEEKRICTSHVERQNLTMRMCIRRLTRLTNAFSKKWEHLKAALALHFAYYNFCKWHSTIRKTPAMAAGITDRVWNIREVVS
jgi:transposase-like protein/IS1 family transposase